MKTCSRCGESRPLGEFYKQKTARDGYNPWCKTCNKERCRDRYRAAPQRGRDYNLRSKYGISQADYDAMLEAQQGCCAICHMPEPKGRLVVDHDHTTGRVRALLCHGCNTMIGLARENPDRMRAGARYIEHHQSSQRRNID